MEPLGVVGKEMLEDIAYSLDRLKGTIEYWRMLIPLLPKESYRYNKIDVEQIALVGTKGGSSSRELLQEFQRKGMNLAYFKNMLQIIECQGALDCFKQPTKPVITEHPKSMTIVVNDKLELRCAAKCIPEPPDYQWFYHGRTPIPLKGAKNWRLIIQKVTTTHNGYYCCRVHNRRRLKDDHYAVFSQYAMVTVKHDKHAELETSRGSTHSPVQEVSDRLHVTFPTSISPSCGMVTDGVSKIELKDPTESTDTVSPDQLIKIITHPKSQTVRLTRVEETVTLECRAESHSGHQLEYKWYYLSGIVNPKTMKKENKDPKSTDPHCIITVKPSKKQVSRYYCEVSIPNQPECCVPSEVAVIKPECVWFVDQPQEKYVTVTGKDLKVSCRVQTTPNVIVKYQWFKCRQNKTGKMPAGYYDNEMILLTNISHRGYYVCGVNLEPAYSDEIYSNVTHVDVVNSVDITVEVQPPTDRYMELNEKLVIEFRAVCKQHPVKYQWYRNGEELTGCTNSMLTIESIANHDMGSYYCEASSDYSAKPVLSETCRVHWKEANAIPSTINRQQFNAEEVMIIDKRIYATDKMALLIGNCKYKGKPLKCSKNDVEAVTDKLRQLNFKTISLVDLTLSEMAKAVDYFCTLLDNGMYAVFYYSGHGLENQKTTYLMPIDADEPARFNQCMNVDDVAVKMQARQSKVVMIFDCCRINPPSSDAASIPPSSIPSSVNQSRGFSNLCQLFACASSFETYESRDGQYSYMTQAFLQEVDKPDTMLHVLSSVQNYHADLKIVPAGGKISPSIQFVVQMKALNLISFHDRILNEQELKPKELLLALPENCCLEFTNPKLMNMYREVELRFSAKFSNTLIIHVVCDPALQPELIGAELECDVQKEDDKTITSFKITNLLDVVQDETSKLQISFQMPQDSSAKETLEYKIPTETIKPTFYH